MVLISVQFRAPVVSRVQQPPHRLNLQLGPDAVAQDDLARRNVIGQSSWLWLRPLLLCHGVSPLLGGEAGKERGKGMKMGRGDCGLAARTMKGEGEGEEEGGAQARKAMATGVPAAWTPDAAWKGADE
jgi:hypothetical protein